MLGMFIEKFIVFLKKGCALTDLEVKELFSVTEHSLDPDPNKIKVGKIKNSIKRITLINRVRATHYFKHYMSATT